MPDYRRRPSGIRRILASLLAVSLLAALGVVVVLAFSRAELSTLTGSRIPRVAYLAYTAAEEAAPSIAGGCSVDWVILAGLARVESKHGQPNAASVIEPNGDVHPVIRGPRLDGSAGTRGITDSDGGELDGDPNWDRAMGPFQFIPTTWGELGRDGNGDLTADPDNLYDAALTAVAHLCTREPGDYTDRSQLRRALVAYNADGRYADEVLRWIDRYRSRPVEDIVVQG